ncbi:hypothetical protein PoB_000787300 [Plakobranchus ocellatus]|uniref:Uncharacterized protein n=1 Tax=Plakobranchus ocellatus TaxID=259542 RepID=A0AAV3YGU5_9GAST|nr:hypothetical protein PoB_000787300 [Plakobranchus ocellatus]
MVGFLYIASPQQGDLRLLGPQLGQGNNGGARTCGRRVPADPRAGSQAIVPPTPSEPIKLGNVRVNNREKEAGIKTSCNTATILSQKQPGGRDRNRDLVRYGHIITTEKNREKETGIVTSCNTATILPQKQSGEKDRDRDLMRYGHNITTETSGRRRQGEGPHEIWTQYYLTNITEKETGIGTS